MERQSPSSPIHENSEVVRSNLTRAHTHSSVLDSNAQNRINALHSHIDARLPRSNGAEPYKSAKADLSRLGLGKTGIAGIVGAGIGAAVGAMLAYGIWYSAHSVFENGVPVSVDGDLNAMGGLDVVGDMGVDGDVSLANATGEAFTVQFAVPVSGNAQFNAGVQLGFTGQLLKTSIGAVFEGSAKVSIGKTPPPLFTAAFVLIFSNVIGYAAALAHRQLHNATQLQQILDRV